MTLLKIQTFALCLCVIKMARVIVWLGELRRTFVLIA
jgi:hypothetical protein